MAPTTIFLIGAPGSGKGTLGSRLCKEYGLYHFSVGDYMRDICRTPDDKDAEIVRRSIQQAIPLPGEIIIPLLQRKMEQEQRNGEYRAFLVDGYPRDMQQAIAFEEEVGQPALVIYLSCPRDEAKRRYLSRKIPGRVEDTDEMFEKRYSDYQVKIVQIGGRYREANILEEVDSSTKTEESYRKLIEALSQNPLWKKIIGA